MDRAFEAMHAHIDGLQGIGFEFASFIKLCLLFFLHNQGTVMGASNYNILHKSIELSISNFAGRFHSIHHISMMLVFLFEVEHFSQWVPRLLEYYKQIQG